MQNVLVRAVGRPLAPLFAAVPRTAGTPQGFHRPPEEAGNATPCLSEVSLIYRIVIPTAAQAIGSNPANTPVLTTHM